MYVHMVSVRDIRKGSSHHGHILRLDFIAPDSQHALLPRQSTIPSTQNVLHALCLSEAEVRYELVNETPLLRMACCIWPIYTTHILLLFFSKNVFNISVTCEIPDEEVINLIVHIFSKTQMFLHVETCVIMCDLTVMSSTW